MLTPLDIDNVVFSRRLTGYDPREVDEFLDRVVESYEALYRENLVLKEKVQALTDRIAEFEKLEESIRESLRAAERAAAEARDQAQARAALLIEQAESEAREITAAAQSRVEQAEQELAYLRRQENLFRLRVRELIHVFVNLITAPVLDGEATAEAAAAGEQAREEQKEEEEQEEVKTE